MEVTSLPTMYHWVPTCGSLVHRARRGETSSCARMPPDADEVCALSNLMGLFWLVVGDANQAKLVPWYYSRLVPFFNNIAVFAIFHVISWAAQVLFIRLGWQTEWWTAGIRRLVCRKLDADERSIGIVGEKLRHAQRPSGTKLWWQSGEKLERGQTVCKAKRKIEKEINMRQRVHTV